ncbi:hypothetical protein HaLaN_26226 [Haematococcus lacustris]|uniref:Uncharacterized protein n=1 Tax=Haematococcus lacustris TaxID=44745 RepID=A0A6A0A5P9_HAELA|nr:hypothetical protein HaLaN_26226 [Haematococcus lacustris]
MLRSSGQLRGYVSTGPLATCSAPSPATCPRCCPARAASARAGASDHGNGAEGSGVQRQPPLLQPAGRRRQSARRWAGEPEVRNWHVYQNLGMVRSRAGGHGRLWIPTAGQGAGPVRGSQWAA